MDSLKKILTVMVITLVVLVVAGGLYVASMGGMNHGAPQIAASDQKDKAKEGAGQNSQPGQQVNQTTPQNSQNPQNTQNMAQDNMTSDKGANNQGQAGTQPVPVIIQVPPPAAKTDQSLYIEQLKARLKSINEANSSIAANSSGQSMVMQQNGSAVPAGQNGMNELHQGFYKLGQDVSSMEKTLDDLASEIKEDQSSGQNQIQTVIPYPNGYPQNMAPNYYQYYPPYQYPSYQQYLNPANQIQPNQNQTGPGAGQQYQSPITQTPAQSNQQSNLQGTDQSMNHSSMSGNFLNANVVKVIFIAILLFSIIFGVISLVGFISSLFKTEKSDGRGTVQI